MNVKTASAKLIKRKDHGLPTITAALADQGIVPCSHGVKFEYWSDPATTTWYAKLTYTEFRQGKQYGGSVVQELTYKGRNWRTDYQTFMKRVRLHVAKQLATFWT